MQDHIKLLQRDLYEKALADASLVGAGLSKSILAYSKKFQESLPSSFKTITSQELLEAIKKNNIILYGDFHALRQSQRGFLRLLRSWVIDLKMPPPVLAMETFRVKDQPLLDQYLNQELKENNFLEKTNYYQEWGFSWPNFRMILEFAREYNLPVFGINSENAGKDPLKVRDSYAADIMVKLRQKFPEATIFCLIGEYHLADEHLPKSLSLAGKKEGIGSLEIMRILTNIDEFYFQLKSKTAGTMSTEYLKLKDDLYCIMNAPPWMKWQSYAIWEELRSVNNTSVGEDESASEADYDIYNEHSFDVAYHFLSLVKNLAIFLGIYLDEDNLETFHIFTSAEDDFFLELKSSDQFTNKEITRIVERATIDGIFFIYKTKTILITEISLNNLAEAAGQYLHTHYTKFTDESADPLEDFYRKIVKATVGMLASKILNPRRKCTTLESLKDLLADSKRKHLTGRQKIKKEVALAVLRFHEWMSKKANVPDDEPKHFPITVCKIDKISDYEVSRIIGHLLGYHLYSSVMNAAVSPKKMHLLFREQLNDKVSLWKEIQSLYSLVLRN